jgi:SAM-dependent methyltransferase
MPDAYERFLAPTVFEPFAVDLAGRVAGRHPAQVLELAAGTGVLTREILAALPGIEVSATDLNAAMVDLGRRHVPGARWRQADAMDLPFGDGEFDLVACQFGVMFFPDKAAAFAETRRVLHPEGVLVFSVWAAIEAHDFETGVVAALAAAFPDDPPKFLESAPHGYADVDVVVADLAAGGMHCVGLQTITLEGHAQSVADLAAGYCTGTPLRAAIETRGDLTATVAIVQQEMEGRFGTGPVTGRMTAHVVEAAPVRRHDGSEHG